LDCFVAEPVIGPAERPDPLAPRNDGKTIGDAMNRKLRKQDTVWT
jgi:hypothetical protein